MKLSPVEIINALATLVLVALLAWAKYREKKMTRDSGLSDNPERCTEHEMRLGNIEKKLEALEGTNREDHGEMFKRLNDLAIAQARMNGHSK
jgi:hypothetical protein